MSIPSLEEETRKLFVKKPGLKMHAEAGGGHKLGYTRPTRKLVWLAQAQGRPEMRPGLGAWGWGKRCVSLEGT